MSDEGVGIHAVQRLEGKIKDERVRVIDGGTMGLDLLPIFEEAECVFIIDCVKGGEKPGTVYKFNPDEIKQVQDSLKMSLHDFNLVDVLNLAKALGQKIPEIIIYGVEPESLEWGMELTPEVSKALDRVTGDIVKDVNEYLKKEKL